MSLYEDLAKAYDEVFPPNPAARDFLLGIYPGQGTVLDLGCATATLLIDLARQGLVTQGLEPSPQMLQVATRNLGASGLDPAALPRVEAGVMLEATRVVPTASLGLLLCLGNTLPHLQSPQELATFLSQARSLLAPGGSLILQLLNYDEVDRKLAAGVPVFPSLAGGGIRFERSYQRREDAALDFLTRITTESGQVQKDTTRLFPFHPREILTALEVAGFGRPLLFSSWAGRPGDFEPGRDPYLIVRAGLDDLTPT